MSESSPTRASTSLFQPQVAFWLSDRQLVANHILGVSNTPYGYRLGL